MRSLRALTIAMMILTSGLLGCRAEERVAHAEADINFALGHLGPAQQAPISLGAGDRFGRDVYCAYLAQHNVEQMYAAE